MLLQGTYPTGTLLFVGMKCLPEFRIIMCPQVECIKFEGPRPNV